MNNIVFPKKRILILGGAFAEIKKFRLSLIRSMVAADFDVYVLSFNYTGLDKELIVKEGATPVEYNQIRGSINPVKELLCIAILFRIVHRISPDILFSFFTKQVIYGSIIGLVLRIPRVVAMLEGLGVAFSTPFGNVKTRFFLLIARLAQIILYNLTLPFINKVIFLNNDDLNDIKKISLVKCFNATVLGPIGLDLRQFKFSKPPPFNHIIFLFVGRLLFDKGIIDFIEAARIVKCKYPCAQFIVCGDIDSDNPRSLSRHDIQSYVNDGTIVWRGYIEDIASAIIESHVFVLPSYYREGFPRSIQEAMAVGRPVITTDSVGCRDSVVDGFDGFIVPPKLPELLAEKMIYFIRNNSSIISMGANARKSAELRFDDVQVNSKLLQIIVGRQM